MTAEQWLAQLTDEPPCVIPPDALLVAAASDWFEEQGMEDVASSLRWMGREGHWPNGSARINRWNWFNASDYPDNDPDDLREEIFQALPGVGATGFWKTYPSFWAAVEALSVALKQGGFV